jgi:DNA-binding MarR family transcriptional regulator
MKLTNDSAPSDLEAHLGFWMRYVSNQVSSRFESQLASHEVTVTEWVALRALYKQSTNTHANLIDDLGMTKGAASKVITKLAAKGLASRGYTAGSAREQVLALTSAGKRLVPKLAAVADENDDFFFGHLSKANRAELMTMMRNLVAHHDMKELPTK